MAAADIHRDDHALGELLHRARHERGVRGGRRAEDRACRAVLEHGGRRFERTDTPADLDGDDDRPADVPDRLPVVAFAEGGIQVDDVEPSGTLLLEPLRDLDGIVRVRRLLAGIAAAQPDRPAAPEIDRRDHDHPETAFTKFA